MSHHNLDMDNLLEGYYQPLDLSMRKRPVEELENEDDLLENTDNDCNEDDDVEYMTLQPQIATSDPEDETDDELDFEQEQLERREAIAKLRNLTENLKCGFFDQGDNVDEIHNSVSHFWNADSDLLRDTSMPMRTNRYLIYLYDCDSSSREGKLWPEKPLTLKEKLANEQTNIYHLTLAEVKTKLLEDQNIKKIWVNSRDSNVTLPEVEELFALFGPTCITHFSYGLPNVSFAIKIPADQFSDFISRYMPNLEFLEFNYTMNTTDKVCYSAPLRPKLLKLKTLKFHQPFSVCWPLMHQLIKASPNLEKIYGFPFLHLKSLRSTKNPPPVKSFSYPSTIHRQPLPGNQDNFRILASICRLKSELEELSIFFQFRVLANNKSIDVCKDTLVRIIYNSQHSLRRLELQPLEVINFIFPDQKFPRLFGVSTLRFNGDSPAPRGKSHMTKKAKMDLKSYNKFFPSEFDINEIFPNLTSVEISVHIDEHESDPIAVFEDFFPVDVFKPCQTFTAVRHLKLCRYMPMVCMERLCSLFPKVTGLSLEMNIIHLTKILPMCLILWPEIEQLNCEIDLSIHPSQNLDSVFLGIPAEKCHILRKMAVKDISPEVVEDYKTEPSICKLKDLKVIRFIFDNSWGRDDLPLFSHVCGLFGFGMMTQLKVFIEFQPSCRRDGKEAILRSLEGISEYVIVDG